MTTKPLVLIVDNEPDIHEVVQVFLEANGYPVKVAETGTQAIKVLTESPPDTILLDYRVPGLTPDGFIKIARSTNQHLPVILMSGIDDIDRKAEALGCEFYIKKPFDIEELPLILEKIRTKKQGP